MKLHLINTPYTVREKKLWDRVKHLKKEVDKRDAEIERLKHFILGL